MKKFKNRYVLGVGQPIFTTDRNHVALWGSSGLSLNIPLEFDTKNIVPKYRLILEKI